MIGIGTPIVFLVLALLSLGVAFFIRNPEFKGAKRIAQGLTALFGIVTLITAILTTIVTVEPGHTGVATLFGKVQDEYRGPGLHFANPLYEWVYYDCRQKTYKEQMRVPSMDQLLTTMDVSVQYRLIPSMTPTLLNETGTMENLIDVHLQPMLRSILREQGKTVQSAEDFFQENVQRAVQENILTVLTEHLADKGVQIQGVLLRDIALPKTIQEGVEAKKKREQEAAREEAELRRFTTQQQQKVATAQAEFDAQKLAAEARKVAADAQAYEIKKINEAIAQNPAYIQLEALNALRAISQNPANQIYFLNSDSPQPLPLMHMGQNLTAKE